MLTMAVATFVLGLILLIWPHATLVVVAILIGAALLVTGVLRLVQGISAPEESGARRTAYVVIGILAILAGLYCLRHISVTIALLAFIVGVFWTAHGVADLVVAAGPGARPDRGLLALAGTLSLIAGLIVIFWSPASLTVLVAVTGIWLILDGLLLAALATRLRRQTLDAARAGRA